MKPNLPPHKHTHLQAAQSQRTNQSLQKSVLLANAQPTDNESDREKGQQIITSQPLKTIQFTDC